MKKKFKPKDFMPMIKLIMKGKLTNEEFALLVMKKIVGQK